MVCVVSVKTANVHDHESETRPGNDVTYHPRDGTENPKEIVTKTETSIEEEMIVRTTTFGATATVSVTTTTTIDVGEMTANAMSAWRLDANSGTRSKEKGSANAKESVVPVLVNETRPLIRSVPAIENVTVGLWTNAMHSLSGQTDATGVGTVETMIETAKTATSARIQGFEPRRRSLHGWTLTYPATLESAFWVARLRTVNWTASRPGSWV